MTDIEKLRQAQKLLEEVYTRYGELLKDNYSICSPLSCADGCINDVIKELNNLKESI